MASECSLRIILVASLLLPSRRQAALGYSLGSDITLCWTSANGGEPQQGDCDGAEVAFTGPWPETIGEGESFNIKYRATIPSELMPKPHVLASIQSCDRSIGFCTPFVTSESSEELQGSLDGATVSFESEVSYNSGQYSLLAVINWEDMMGSVHHMARARQQDVEKPTSPLVYALIALSAGIAILVFGVGGFLGYRLYKKFKLLREVARRSYRERIQRVLQAYGQTRTNKLLFFFDTVDEILGVEIGKQIVFISHQWTGQGVPDPTGVQFRTIVRAIDTIAEAKGLNAADLLVWIDYTSIPQRSRALQTLSIASLPVYATFASHFIVVAPEVVATPEKVFSLGTYKVRGWCRLEQWARLAQKSVENMWICDGSLDGDNVVYPASNDATFTTTAMRVFQGDFTVDNDRFKLIDVLVGLYAMLLEHGSVNSSMRALLDEVKANSKTVYPAEYFEDLLEIVGSLRQEGVLREIDKEHHSLHMDHIMDKMRNHAHQHSIRFQLNRKDKSA